MCSKFAIMALWRSFSSVCCTSFGSRPCVVPLHTRSRAFSVRNATASASSDVDQLLPVFEDVKENLQEPTRRSQSSPKEKGPSSYFPKKGQDIELVCESLAYKGNGVCKVVETGFVVLCERALPGERLLARIVKKKRGFAEVILFVSVRLSSTFVSLRIRDSLSLQQQMQSDRRNVCFAKRSTELHLIRLARHFL